MKIPKTLKIRLDTKLVYPNLLAIFATIGFFIAFLGQADKFLLGCCIFSMAVNLLFFIYLIKAFFVPLKKQTDILQEHQRQFLKNKLEAYTAAITKFSTGNLTVTIDDSKVLEPLSEKLEGPIGELMKTSNKIASTLGQSIDDFNSITAVPTKRLCFLGNNAYEEGQLAGEEIGNFLSGSGKIVIVLPSFQDANHNLRCKGCQTVLKERFSGIEVVQSLETQANPEITCKAVGKIFDQRNDINIIYITEGNTPSHVGQLIAKKRLKNKCFVACHDILKPNVQLIKDGLGALIIGQNAYTQTHNALIHIYNHIVADWNPVAPRLLMRPVVVDNSNINEHWNDSVGRIMSEELKQELISPMARRPGYSSGKIVKLGVILPEISSGSFWQVLGDGAKKAIKELQEHNVKVSIVDTFDSYNNFAKVSVTGPVIERFIKEKYDGFIVTVFDRNVTPMINKAVEAGLAVATFNTEPSSFREMLNTVSNNVGSLINHSQGVAEAAAKTNQTIIDISEKLEEIKKGSLTQSEQVLKTEVLLNSFLYNINNVDKLAEETTESVKSASQDSAAGFEAVSQSREGINIMKRTSKETNMAILALRDRLLEINKAILTIIDISDDTTILSLNARIQSAKAGEHEKGFSIVTEEIRKLADQSKLATTEIINIINSLQGHMSQTEKATSIGIEQVTKNVDLADKAEASLKSIKDSLQTNEINMQSVDVAISEMQQSSKDAKNAMRQLNDLNTSNTTSLENIKSATDIMTKQSDDLSKTAQKLKDMAKNQKTLFSQFTIHEN